MLDKLTIADFAPLVGTAVPLLREGAPPLTLTVELTNDLSVNARPGHRAPFSVWFVGPAEPVLPQRIYAMELGALGRLEIFIAPIERVPAGVRYEANFN